MKFLEENIGGKFLDIRLGEDFLSRTRKTKATKAKPNGVTANEKAPAQQRPPPGRDKAAAGGENITASHLSGKGLISKINKELMQSIAKWPREQNI